MSEVISTVPVVEVRETFIPSPNLRRALEPFLHPEITGPERESLQAAFLFKSWRRKILSRDNYYTPGRERDQSVREASIRFEQLPSTPINFDGNIKLVLSRRGSSMARLVLQPRMTEFARDAINILELIPNDGPETALDMANSLYIDIARRNLTFPYQLREARDLLRHKLTHPGTTRLHTVRTGHVVAKDTIIKSGDLS